MELSLIEIIIVCLSQVGIWMLSLSSSCVLLKLWLLELLLVLLLAELLVLLLIELLEVLILIGRLRERILL